MCKRIIFISEEFYPLSNGTISCVENVLPTLTEKFNVELYTKYRGIIGTEEINNLMVIRPNNILDRLFYWRKMMIQSGDKRGGISSKGIDVFKWVTYPLVLLNNRFGYLSNKAWSKNLIKYINKRKIINNDDVIIAIGAPFSNIRSAVAIKQKHPKVLLVLVEFDLYTENSEFTSKNVNANNSRIKRLSEEDEWFSMADRILVTDEMYETLMNSELGKWKDKIRKFKMPNLVNMHRNRNLNISNCEDGSINIVYTGKFYEDIRNPGFALNIFSELIKINPKLRLHIYGSGCEELIHKYIKILGDNLIFHGHKSKEEAHTAILFADYLLSIGNNTITQAPSKIIEYISTGIPIINIFTHEKDRSREILKSYDLSVSVKENREKLGEITSYINQFINENLNSRVSYVDILTKYRDYSPESFSDSIAEIIRNYKQE